MSILNLGLQAIGVMREEMSTEFEKHVKVMIDLDSNGHTQGKSYIFIGDIVDIWSLECSGKVVMFYTEASAKPIYLMS